MPTSAERALRREVTRLAKLEPDDLDAVLAGLSLEQRQRTEALLREYLSPSPPAISRDALSPWVEARIAGEVAGMTERARDALASCSQHLVPRAAVPTPSHRERGHLGRMISGFAAWGRP